MMSSSDFSLASALRISSSRWSAASWRGDSARSRGFGRELFDLRGTNSHGRVKLLVESGGGGRRDDDTNRATRQTVDRTTRRRDFIVPRSRVRHASDDARCVRLGPARRSATGGACVRHDPRRGSRTAGLPLRRVRRRILTPTRRARADEGEVFDDGSRGRGAHAPAPRAHPGAAGGAAAAAGSWQPPPPRRAGAASSMAPVAAGPAPGVAYADLMTRSSRSSSTAIILAIIVLDRRLIRRRRDLDRSPAAAASSSRSCVVLGVICACSAAPSTSSTCWTTHAGLARAEGPQPRDRQRRRRRDAHPATRRSAAGRSCSAPSAACSARDRARSLARHRCSASSRFVYVDLPAVHDTQSPKRQGFHDVQAGTVVVKRALSRATVANARTGPAPPAPFRFLGLEVQAPHVARPEHRERPPVERRHAPDRRAAPRSRPAARRPAAAGARRPRRISAAARDEVLGRRRDERGSTPATERLEHGLRRRGAQLALEQQVQLREPQRAQQQRLVDALEPGDGGRGG